jgi:hypothetical protein
MQSIRNVRYGGETATILHKYEETWTTKLLQTHMETETLQAAVHGGK